MGGPTLHESFASSFDRRTFDRSAAMADAFAAAQSFSNGEPPTGTYGFGTCSIRFKNQVRDSAFGNFGVSNATTIPLTKTAPIPIESMAGAAPSKTLPEYASTFEIPLGQSYAKTPSRDAPYGPNGEKLYYVMAKDKGNGEPGEIFTMQAPRGAGPRTTMHDITDGLMTPAERREALIFNKCRDRAEKMLRKQASDACRMTLTMKRNHPHGVLGLESADCPDTVVYARERAALLAQEKAATEQAMRRHDNLSRRRDSQLPAPMLEHNPYDTTQARLFPRVGKVDIEAARPCERHYVVRPVTMDTAAYRSNLEKPLAPQRTMRTEHLNDMDAGGRAYDIITGIQRPVPPTRSLGGELLR